MSDGTVKNADIIKNTSNGSDGFFNYNIINDKGEVIDVVQIGKLKLTMYSLEGVKH